MVFQSYAFESTTYSPINMGHASFSAVPPTMALGGCGSKKRKALDDDAASSSDLHIRPKLSLPRSAGLVFNGDARFHPLPAHVNQEVLAQLGHSPFANAGGEAGSAFVTPSSSSSSLHEQPSAVAAGRSDYFSSPAAGAGGQYPEVQPYPSSAACGILGPAPAPAPSDMDLDGASTNAQSVHGSHCKSIPQLCVRYNDGNGSELWATCPDCGTCGKVDSSRPSANLCYSP